MRDYRLFRMTLISMFLFVFVVFGSMNLAHTDLKKQKTKSVDIQVRKKEIRDKIKDVSIQTNEKDWWRDAIFYQIFMRSFQDSNADGIGDINGLIRRLDYLNDGDPKTKDDLGIDAIWLSPIFESPSYHGYDTTNYRKIQSVYGTLQDLQKLLKEAHKRGIRIILDLVINHTSRQHPWFRDSASSVKSRYRSWYIWKKKNPHWHQPWNAHSEVWHPFGKFFYYGLFWRGMPDLNLRHPATQKEIFDITKYWLSQGVDGFRLDAARYLMADGKGSLQSDRPDTHLFWRRYRKFCKKISDKTVLIGEIWSNIASIAPYCKGDQFDLAFQFPLSKAIYQSVTSMTVEPFWKVWKRSHLMKSYFGAIFLSNHDQERIMSQLHDQKEMMRLAAMLLLTMTGTPFIYYGEEIALTNGTTNNDEAKRSPMLWDASKNAGFTKGKAWYPLSSHRKNNVDSQRKSSSSLFALYRDLIKVRHRFVALRRGKMIPLKATIRGKPTSSVLVFMRQFKKQKMIVVINLSDQILRSVKVSLPCRVSGLSIVFREGQTKIKLQLTKNLSSFFVTLPSQGGFIATIKNTYLLGSKR